ncbi:raptor N-terminal caspase like domain-containing protein [Haematococcus lacustris]
MTDHGRSLTTTTTAPEDGAIPPASSESGAQGSRPGGSLPQEQSDVGRQPAILCEECHDAGVDEVPRPGCGPLAALKWRQKEKLKTTAVALVLCLNIGVDPPDVIKISPCARLECWVDPLSMQPARALETIGKNLQAQYERWQPKAKYKMHLDPTVEDVKKLAVSSRKNAKAERTLFHYNGHGVPRPTANGELWVFNSRYTQYIPLSVFELHSWLGTPCIYVLDCSSAGVVINSFKAMLEQRVGSFPGSQPGAPAANDPLREIIVLAACGANEVLPQNPELPADVFTSCLTTPIKVSLRWFCSRSLLRHDGITKELIDKIPGKQTDRKTPLGELNWIFTAITDTIAWDVLPRPLFQKLFRSDLLVASLFRNFLLAQRIMSSANCCPVSYPRLPPTHQHPLWQAWDMAAEMCLMQLPTLLSDPGVQFQASPFFTEQLTAFELWLASGGRDKKPPEQLPIVLQVLLSTVHRLRALVLLGRFLDMGPWAVDLALSVGIFPYVLKLLVTTSQDLRATLVFIWAKILVLDTSCQVDLVKDNGHTYFITFLDAVDPGVELSSRAQATFVLAAICDNHPKGQRLCTESDLLLRLLNWLRQLFPPQVPFPTPGHGLLLKWLCLCLGKLCQDNPGISLNAIREGAADLLVQLLTVASPEIRAAAVFGLGCLVHSGRPAGAAGVVGGPDAPEPPTEDRLPAEQLIANAVRQVVYDPSVLVRCELAVLYARFVRGHAPMVQEALGQQQRRLQEFAAKQQQAAQSALQASGGSQTQRRSGEGGPLAGETEASWLQRSMSAATSTSAVGLRVGEATTEALPAASHLSTSPSRPSSCPPGASHCPSCHDPGPLQRSRSCAN